MRPRHPPTHLNLPGPAPDSAPFDQHYVDRLRRGCALTAAHFSSHFSRLLDPLLRRYVRQTDLVDDIRQETLLRVLQIVSREDFRPERFEAFVLRTARLVSYEMMRAEQRYCAPAENAPERADTRPTPEAIAIEQACAKRTSETLASMEGRDARILSMILNEDVDRSEICRRLGMTEAYLRVVIHRARARFQLKTCEVERGLGRAA
jgi:RNA polymerase sigma factor (sigma-70 family)